MKELSISYAQADLLGCEFFFSQEPMSEEEMGRLLAQESLTLIEALHLCCLRKIHFPSSYFLTREMKRANSLIGRAKERGEFQVEKWEVRAGGSTDCQLIESNSGCEFLLRIKDQQATDFCMPTFSFIEWAINSELPLPDELLRMVGVHSLVPYSFNRIRMLSVQDFTFMVMEVKKLSKPTIWQLQIQAAAQIVLFECHDLPPEKIEFHPAVSRYIPSGKYSKNSKAFQTHAGYLLPEKKRGHPPGANKKQVDQLLPKPIWDIFETSENIKIYYDLRKLKLVCITIAEVLKYLRPQISLDEVKNHDCIQMYMTDCHPLIWRMHENWLAESLSS